MGMEGEQKVFVILVLPGSPNTVGHRTTLASLRLE